MVSIEIRSKGHRVDQEIRRFAERRISFALDRFRNLRRIVVSTEDVNGPKGGVDKLCRIIADFGFATVVVHDVQPKWQTAVAGAIRRVARKVERKLQRVNHPAFEPANRAEIDAASLINGDAERLIHPSKSLSHRGVRSQYGTRHAVSDSGAIQSDPDPA